MLYCPNCQCQSCQHQTAQLHAKMSSGPYAPPTRYAPKRTITCGWCQEEHKTFEDIQWCRRTIDARSRTTFEEAAVAAWELLERLRETS
jgi:hypothetical protein